jgi:hypothetical protein
VTCKQHILGYYAEAATALAEVALFLKVTLTLL